LFFFFFFFFLGEKNYERFFSTPLSTIDYSTTWMTLYKAASRKGKRL
jgi:hypothetical protein